MVESREKVLVQERPGLSSIKKARNDESLQESKPRSVVQGGIAEATPSPEHRLTGRGGTELKLRTE
eukprot:1876364-Prorocentrum_lima.AAC.1